MAGHVYDVARQTILRIYAVNRAQRDPETTIDKVLFMKHANIMKTKR